MPKKNSWLLCAALAGAMGHASAADLSSLASGSNSVTGLAYHLIDLDLSDGITPWITFNGNRMGAGAYLADGTSPFNSVEGNLFSAPAVSYTSPDGKLTSTYSPAEQTSRIRLDSTDIQNVQPDDDSLIQYGGVSVGVVLTHGSSIDSETGLALPLDGETTWTMSANTALVIDGEAEMKGSVDLSHVASGALVQGANDGQYTFSLQISNQVNIKLASSDGTYDEANPALNTWQDYGPSGVLGLATEQRESLPFAVRLDNHTAEALDGDLNFSVASIATLVFGQGTLPEVPPITSIPEPSSWGLMALGLGLMAWQVKRPNA